MTRVEEKLATLEAEKRKLLGTLQKERANKQFRCGCGAMHKIKDCHALSHMHYTSPSGCIGGDYWSFSELQVICPVTDCKNRFLYDSKYRIDWSLRRQYDYCAEMQFNHMYMDLFKSVTPDYDKDRRKWWNNTYVDKHHEKFGIRLKEVK